MTFHLYCLLLFDLSGAASPSEHLQHLHRTGDSLLPVDSAAAPSRPGSLQAAPAGHRCVHDLRQYQSAACCPLPSFSSHEYLPN